MHRTPRAGEANRLRPNPVRSRGLLVFEHDDGNKHDARIRTDACPEGSQARRRRGTLQRSRGDPEPY